MWNSPSMRAASYLRNDNLESRSADRTLKTRNLSLGKEGHRRIHSYGLEIVNPLSVKRVSEEFTPVFSGLKFNPLLGNSEGETMKSQARSEYSRYVQTQIQNIPKLSPELEKKKIFALQGREASPTKSSPFSDGALLKFKNLEELKSQIKKREEKKPEETREWQAESIVLTKKESSPISPKKLSVNIQVSPTSIQRGTMEKLKSKYELPSVKFGPMVPTLELPSYSIIPAMAHKRENFRNRSLMQRDTRIIEKKQEMEYVKKGRYQETNLFTLKQDFDNSEWQFRSLVEGLQRRERDVKERRQQQRLELDALYERLKKEKMEKREERLLVLPKINAIESPDTPAMRESCTTLLSNSSLEQESHYYPL